MIPFKRMLFERKRLNKIPIWQNISCMKLCIPTIIPAWTQALQIFSNISKLLTPFDMNLSLVSLIVVSTFTIKWIKQPIPCLSRETQVRNVTYSWYTKLVEFTLCIDKQTQPDNNLFSIWTKFQPLPGNWKSILKPTLRILSTVSWNWFIKKLLEKNNRTVAWTMKYKL